MTTTHATGPLTLLLIAEGRADLSLIGERHAQVSEYQAAELADEFSARFPSETHRMEGWLTLSDPFADRKAIHVSRAGWAHLPEGWV